MKRLITGLICLALLQAAAVQPARTQGTATGKPFRMAFLMGTTGPNPGQQAAIMLGASEAAKKLNAQGGILGRPVVITTFDHQFDPARAVRILQEDVLTQSWDVISPGGGTATTIPMLPFVTKAKAFSIASTLNADPAKITAENPTFFDVYPSPLDAAAAFADYLVHEKVKKIAMIYTTDSFGVNSDNVYEAAVRKTGIPIVSEGIDIGTVDVSPTLLKLQGQKPDRLFIMVFGAAAGHLFNSIDKIGWYNIPMIGDPITGLNNLPSMAPARSYANLLVQTQRISAYKPPEQRSAKLNAFIDAIKQAGPITQGLQNYTLGWDMVMLPALAAKKANSTDQQKMIAAMEHLNLAPRDRTYLTYDEYNYTPTNHQVTTPPHEYSWVPYTPLADGMVGKH